MKISHLKESDAEKSHEKDEDDYFEKLEIKKKIFNVKSKEKVPHQKFSRTNDRIAENTIKNIRKFCNQMIQIQHKDDASEKVKDRQFFTQLAKVLSK